MQILVSQSVGLLKLRDHVGHWQDYEGQKVEPYTRVNCLERLVDNPADIVSPRALAKLDKDVSGLTRHKVRL